MADPEQTPLLVIGAGPYGLATAAEAKRLGVPPVVLGEPMGFWRANMPAAMFLRSGRDWHLDAAGEHTLDAYVEAQGLDPDALDPIPIDVFIGYADWFTAQKGLEPRRERVRALTRRDGGGFEARMEDGSTILADQVVAAPGIAEFAVEPALVREALAPGQWSHTARTVEFEGLEGRRCLILGGRQSAFEWAALLAEAGAARVDVVHRHDTPEFTPSDWSFVDDLLAHTRQTRGWFRRLPESERAAIAQRFWQVGRLQLEPWLADRIAVRQRAPVAARGADRDRQRAGRRDHRHARRRHPPGDRPRAARHRLQGRHAARALPPGRPRAGRRLPGARRGLPDQPRGPLRPRLPLNARLRPVLRLRGRRHDDRGNHRPKYPARHVISTNQFKNGNHIDVEGTIFKIIEFQHVKPGKGGAFVRTKLRRTTDGAVIDRTFRAGEKFRSVHTESRKMQFLYTDGTDAHFMDSESYEQIALSEESVQEPLQWILPNETVDLLYIDDQPGDIQLAASVELEVTHTEPGMRGDTASGGGTKPATLETGATVSVPLFVNIGDRVKVDTRSGSYMSRA